jgi:hypothetical protein
MGKTRAQFSLCCLQMLQVQPSLVKATENLPWNSTTVSSIALNQSYPHLYHGNSGIFDAFLSVNIFKIRPPNVQGALKVILGIYIKLINIESFRELHEFILEPMAMVVLTSMMIIINIFIIIFQFISQSYMLYSAPCLHLQPDTSDKITIYGELILVGKDVNETCDNYSLLYGIDDDNYDDDDAVSSSSVPDIPFLSFEADDDSLIFLVSVNLNDDVDDSCTVFSISSFGCC